MGAIFDFFQALSWASLIKWAMETMPGWLLLSGDMVLAALIAWMHRNPSHPEWRFSIAYFRDAVLSLVMLAVLVVALLIIAGWIKVS